MSTFIENPFLNTNLTFYNDDTGKNIDITAENISQYYSHIFILVKTSNVLIPPDFYTLQIPVDIFEKVSSNLIIHKISTHILRTSKHFDSIISMSDKLLQKYNIFNYELGVKNIVLPILNIQYHALLSYLEQYESSHTIKNLYNLKIINQYFDYSNELHILQIIDNLYESSYWTKPNNCLSNFITRFTCRNFLLSPLRIINKDAYNLFITLKPNHNYLENVQHNHSLVVNKFYKISKQINMTSHDINQLFMHLTEKQRFFLFCNLLISKVNAHLVINNETILDLMKGVINSYAPLIKYLLSYTWIKFYHEENIIKKNIKTTNNFVFDINTASKLPVFPFNYYKPKENPYMPLLIDNPSLNYNGNIGGIITNGDNKGICNLEKFRMHLNIFATNNAAHNLFEKIDFNKLKIGITGSVITACIQEYHPLLSLFNNCESYEDKFMNYINEYYALSDIDIMFLADTTENFIDNVKDFYNQISINICNFNGVYTLSEFIKLNLLKSAAIFITKDFIETTLKMDFKYFENNITSDEIKLVVQPYYETLIKEKYQEFIKDKSQIIIDLYKIQYPDLFETENIEVNVYINKNMQMYKPIDLVFNYKYKIVSPYLNHSLELFPVKSNDFFSIVSQFHLPNVRGYYNGNNVYLLPSCITAHMTFMNIDYKYVSGTKDPIDIINKNRMRGFGIWLNNTELKIYNEYCDKVPFWKNLNSLTYGPLPFTHKLFAPRLYNQESYTNAMYVDIENRYKVINNIQSNFLTTQLIINKFNSINIKEINFDHFIAINDSGKIIPLKKWLISFIWNIVESQYIINKTDYNNHKKKLMTKKIDLK